MTEPIGIQERDFHSKACRATLTEHPEPIKPERFLINQRDLMNAMGIRRNKTKEDIYKRAIGENELIYKHATS